MKNFLMLFLFCCIMIGCSSKVEQAPCGKELQCKDCNCLFDEIQKNLNNPEKLQKAQECYEKYCKD